jgi:hypothetical protein
MLYNEDNSLKTSVGTQPKKQLKSPNFQQYVNSYCAIMKLFYGYAYEFRLLVHTGNSHINTSHFQRYK